MPVPGSCATATADSSAVAPRGGVAAPFAFVLSASRSAPARTSLTGASGARPLSPGERLLHGAADPRADRVGLLLAGSLDHHANQRLGARGPNEHPAAPPQAGVFLLDRALDRGVLER